MGFRNMGFRNETQYGFYRIYLLEGDMHMGIHVRLFVAPNLVCLTDGEYVRL